jgi:GNAT superfamily N-acetyltransferase
LIVGPSGSGKSTIARALFGEHTALEWNAGSVIDDFPADYSLQDITEACSQVGFNTVPAWARPYDVLSTGEKFRVDLARRILTLPSPIVVDEFTSVVDRQVAQVGSHAVQKFIRKTGKRFVAVSCHYDIVDWLQPDWIFEPTTMSYSRRSLRRRPQLDISIKRVPYAYWRLFAPFHYLTNELSKASMCYVLFVGSRPASFAGVLHRPHPKVDDIKGVSRLVTLPDWQGLGLAMVLVDQLGAAYKAVGKRLHTYPAHPSLIRTFDKSANWRLEKKPGTFSSPLSLSSTLYGGNGKIGGRACAMFAYSGQAMDVATAQQLLAKG